MKRRHQAGFTLVEIAIVLVIVGLLLGAVLKGQELIFNTKIKNTYNLSRETAAALYAYQDRYRRLPGDDNTAATRFPTANPVPTNGGGDGWIAWGNDCSTGYQTAENCQALYHMRLAGFISGTGSLALRTGFDGIASPAAWGQYQTNAGNSPALGFHPTGVTHKIMQAIDTSFDDGDPTTGSVRCRSVTTYNPATPDTNMPDWCSISM